MVSEWENIPIISWPERDPRDEKQEHTIKITVELDGEKTLEFQPMKISNVNAGEFEIHVLEKFEWDPYALCQAPQLTKPPKQRVWFMLSMGEPTRPGQPIYTLRLADESSEGG